MAKPNQKKGRSLRRAGRPSSPGSAGQMLRNANRWREQYNPLRGLTLARAVQMFEAFQRGDLPELMWAYRFIERRHPVLRAGILRRRSALLKLDWEIKTCEEDKLPPGATKEMAEAQQQTLRNAYDAIDNLKGTIRHLALAEFRGFSIIQKHRSNDGEVIHLECLNHWNFSREGLFGDFFYNESAQSTSDPVSALGEGNRLSEDGGLPRQDFIIREVDMPVNEIGLLCFIRRNLSTKDWDAFVEIYGIPGGVVIMPPNVPSDKEDDYESAAKSIAEGGSGALPNGSDYKPNDSPRGVNPFKDHKRDLDEDLVLAITGGKLTMLAESGSGTLAGGAHQDAFDDIAQGEAAEISEVFQSDFDAEVLSREHPGQPVLAYFEICAKDETDVDSLVKNCVSLRGAGYRIDPDWLAEKTGYEIEEEQQQNNPPEPENGERVPRERYVRNRDDATVLAAAAAADLQPLLRAVDERMQRVLNISDPQLRLQKFRALWAELAPLRKDITADPASARVIEQANADALARGLKGAKP